MVFSLNGFDSDADAFLFYLGTQLGKTVAELDALSYAEYVQWVAYFKAKGQKGTERKR